VIKLYVNGSLVDLTGSEEISVDYSIAKIGEFNTRSGSRSIEFRLPKTANNRLILENPDDTNSNSILPYRNLDARLDVDGIDQRILFATIEKSDKHYNVRLYGDNVTFYNQIKGKKLIDLDLKEYDHYRNLDQTINDRDRTDGYLYPVIDYFADSPNLYMWNLTTQVFANYLYPAPYIESMIEHICLDAGYTLNNKIKELNNYPQDGICLPYSSVDFGRNKDMKRYEATIRNSAIVQSGATGSPAYVPFTTPDSSYQYPYFAAGSLAYKNIGLIKPLWFIDGIKARVVIRYTCTNVSGSDAIGKIGVLPALVITADHEFNIGNGDTVTGEHDFGYLECPLGTNPYTFFAAVTSARTSTGGALSIGALAFSNIEVEISDVTLLKDGFNPLIEWSDDVRSYVTLSSILPNMNQSELFLQYLKMFCGLVTVDERTKTVTIFSFNKIAENVNIAKDWSYKLDISQDISVEYDLGYAQNNYLLYEDDETVVKPLGTDGLIQVEDTTLEQESNLVELDFAASGQVVRMEDNLLSQIKMLAGIGGPEPTFDKVKQRILAVRFKDFPAIYKDGVDSETISTDIPLPYFIDSSNTLGLEFNLGFEDNLLNYYSEFKKALDKSKILTCSVRLNATDIEQLDFTIPVYIKYFESYFYISQVKEYTPTATQSTEVELVKIF